MNVPVAGELLEEPRRHERLQFALVLELQLPARDMVCEDKGRERLRSLDVGDECRAGEVGCPRRHVQVELADIADRPAARDRSTLAIRLPDLLMRDMKLRPEQIDHLIVFIRLDRLDESDEIGLELPEAVDQERAASVPVATDPPEVLGDDPHQSEVWAATTRRSRLGVTSTAATTPTRAATPAIVKATS